MAETPDKTQGEPQSGKKGGGVFSLKTLLVLGAVLLLEALAITGDRKSVV